MSRLNGGRFLIDLTEDETIPNVSQIPFEATKVYNTKEVYELKGSKPIDVKLRFVNDEFIENDLVISFDYDGYSYTKLHKDLYFNSVKITIDLVFYEDNRLSINVRK